MNIRKSPLIQEEEVAKCRAAEGIDAIRAHIEKKNTFKNLSRCLSEDQRAQNKASAINKAKEIRHVQQYDYQKDEQLSRELNKCNRQDMVEKKLRQHLRDNCHELKELETKLRAAYVNKELVAQLAEHEAKRVEEKIKEKQAQQVLEDARVNDVQCRNLETQERINYKAKYKQELQDQMIFNERSRRFQYDEFLQEKKTMDDIAQRMYDEDERARQEKWCQMKKNKDEIEAFKTAQQFWKDKQKQEIAEEDQKLQEYVFSKVSDAQAKKEAKERKEAARTKVIEDIALKTYQTKRKYLEREELILQLLEEEKLEEQEKRHREELEKEVLKRQETLHSLNLQVEEQKERMRKQAEEDARYKEQLIIKIAEDERVEQLSNEKRRLKVLEVRRMVEKQMAENRQLKAEEMQRQMKLLEIEQAEAALKERIIQEERVRILKEHGHNLIGFMPKGAIQPEDAEYLGSDLINQWSRKE